MCTPTPSPLHVQIFQPLRRIPVTRIQGATHHSLFKRTERTVQAIESHHGKDGWVRNPSALAPGHDSYNSFRKRPRRTEPFIVYRSWCFKRSLKLRKVRSRLHREYSQPELASKPTSATRSCQRASGSWLRRGFAIGRVAAHRAIRDRGASDTYASYPPWRPIAELLPAPWQLIRAEGKASEDTASDNRLSL